MKKTLKFTLVFIFLSATLLAQENRFYMPKEIKDAYDNGTRSYDGKPGAKYWQNTADYDIDVEVIPSSRELIGSEKVVYHNNSPDELNQIVVRLYHDVFKKGNQRGMSVKDTDINEGVEISNLSINGTSVDMAENTRRFGTNMLIRLPETLKSGEKLTMEASWKMVIPETTRRTGTYDSTSFFVAYWYPQIAVYDDVFGWDLLSYDFSTEFYNNLGNFDVTIKAPETFTIMATGVLQNAEEVLQPEKLDLYNQAKASDETVTIISAADITGNHQHKSGTWNYKASEVTDFSFCLSDHFIWDGANQQVEDRDVFISTFYNVNVAEQASRLTAAQQKTMKHFSEDMPAIPYPYPEFTTCVMGVGGGGMETPMMANNGQPGLGVTIHEMFHTYFPMYVRINEKRFAWMDEGWANFNTDYVNDRYFQNDTSKVLVSSAASQISGTLGSISDLPLITSTQFMDNSNYGYASYPLPAFLYSVLHHHLGEALFSKCYNTYIKDWAEKSPTPYDFIYTFERVSGQDLSWFWQPWFFRYGYVEVGIESFEKGKLKIKNMGSRPVPLIVNVTYEDGSTWQSDHSASIWNKQKEFVIEIPNYKKVKDIGVNQPVPDLEILNNFYPTLKERYGDFKMAEKYLGEYTINEFPVTVLLAEEEGFVKLFINGAGIDVFLVPENNTTFHDLTDNYHLTLEENEDGKVGLSLTIDSFGVKLTGKME
ncbi:MAG: M1 family metallopeptidase [Fulvivirga sp.]|nr:M1 family metallopeptidase [Fulvivirga sp.]